MKKWITVYLFLIMWMLATQLWAAPVPDTGQTKCYNDSVEIPCPSPGQDYYGQDGNYTMNPPSYTKLDSNGNALLDSATSWAMVKDNVTGLIWEVKTNKDEIQNYNDPHDADNTYTWYDSKPATNGGYAGTSGDGTDTEDFIKQLNDSNFGGHSDWRIPTIKELAYLVDRSIPYPGPTIDAAYFPNTAASWYWSSTTSADDTGAAWVVDFYYGHDGYGGKNYYDYVRAVRGGQSGTFDNLVIGSFDSVNQVMQSTLPEFGFTDNGDGTVTDSSTGLMWQQETADSPMTWNEALAYCEGLNLCGHSDWRLPNINDLRSLIDYSRSNPTIDISYFPDTAVSWYWSSTTGASATSGARGVNFDYGYGLNVSKSSNDYVRAVRGGQNRFSGHLLISIPAQAAFLSIGANTQIQWETSGISGNVAITLSRDGGKTWESIIESTPNDTGSYTWTVTGPQSVNCMLKIEPVNDPIKGTVQGLFTIYQQQAATINLSGPGWNLISLPLQPSDTSIGAVLAGISGQYASVWSFQNGAWLVYDPANPDFSDLTNMEAGWGYWLNMTEPATLSFTGATPSPSMNLFTGWNLVGYNSSTAIAIADALSSITGNVVSVWAYMNDAWLVYDPANPDFSDLSGMMPGYGYWINTNGACTWTLP